MDEMDDELTFWYYAETFEACLSWQICGDCLINSVVIWPHGKYALYDIPCVLCGGLTITTGLVACAN